MRRRPSPPRRGAAPLEARRAGAAIGASAVSRQRWRSRACDDAGGVGARPVAMGATAADGRWLRRIAVATPDLVRQALPWLLAAVALAAVAAYIVSSLTSLRHTARVAAELGDVRAAGALTIGAAFTPIEFGGGEGAVRATSGAALQRLEATRPEVEALLGPATAEERLRAVESSLVDLRDGLIALDGDGDAFVQSGAAVAFVSFTSQVSAPCQPDHVSHDHCVDALLSSTQCAYAFGVRTEDPVQPGRSPRPLGCRSAVRCSRGPR